jgi:hypothetical protein
VLPDFTSARVWRHDRDAKTVTRATQLSGKMVVQQGADMRLDLESGKCRRGRSAII